jgi:two-component system chemotaxis sensor kinase CheA
VTDDSPTPFSDFLDDYFAECNDHVMGVRRLLLALEVSVWRADINRVLEELFRHFHSLKGISGMIELRPAEDLGHHLEDYLRVLRQSEGILTADGVDALFDGTQMLEQVIGSRRAGNAAPPIGSVVSRIAHLVTNTAAERAAAKTSPRSPAVRSSSAGTRSFILRRRPSTAS